MHKGSLKVLQTTPIVESVVDDLKRGQSRGVISKRFHNTLIRMFAETCLSIRDETGINEVALSGGAFQNMTLLAGLSLALEEKAFTVYSHAHIPTNDGGICLGQAVCAGLNHSGEKGAFEQDMET
jgi:hydrogenase maturation protein HypF